MSADTFDTSESIIPQAVAGAGLHPDLIYDFVAMHHALIAHACHLLSKVQLVAEQVGGWSTRLMMFSPLYGEPLWVMGMA